jgi:hypothetical protein
LLALLPAADHIASQRWTRYLGLALLLVSAVTAAYACLNPWSHPWIYQYGLYMGWMEQ